MEPWARQQKMADLERARRNLEWRWSTELLLGDPDWMLLFELHFSLVRIERRLRLLGRSQ
jgi:hypothetical protein